METYNIEEKLTELEGFERKLFNLGKEMFAPGEVGLYPLDILAAAVMDRSLSLIFGFTSLIRANNFTCAAPLVRMHLDNLLRFYGAYISNDPHDFTLKVFKGEHIRRLKDKDGKKMLDSYLVEKLSLEHPWIKKVYEETSGYVHLSNKHIFNSSRLRDFKQGQIEFHIGREDKWLTGENKLEATACMIEISDILYQYLYGWSQTKRVKVSNEISGK